MDKVRVLGGDNLTLTYKRIKQNRPDVSLNLLYALEGALWGIHYLELDRQFREQLKQEYEKGIINKKDV